MAFEWVLLLGGGQALKGGTENKPFGEEDLSHEAKKELQRIKDEGHIGICSKCRWRSGCLNCSFEKALRYHLKKEALRAGKAVAGED